MQFYSIVQKYRERISTKLCDISKKANFHRFFDAPIVPISLKFRANVRNFAWHFAPRTTKFHATVYLGSEITWNISFVGVEIKLNVDERKKEL